VLKLCRDETSLSHVLEFVSSEKMYMPLKDNLVLAWNQEKNRRKLGNLIFNLAPLMNLFIMSGGN